MQKICDFTCTAWISSVDSNYRAEPGKRSSLPLFGIVKTLKQHMEDLKSQLDEGKRRDLAEKVKILSKEKLEYYRSTRFGWIKEFFSCLRNRCLLGTWQSSGQLGLKLSQKIMPQIQGQANSQPSLSNGKADEISAGPQANGLESNGNAESNSKAKKKKGIVSRGLAFLRKLKQKKKKKTKENDEKVERKSDVQVPRAALTAYENMVMTFQAVWTHADDAQRNVIKQIAENMFRSINLVSWKPTGTTNEYELELAGETHGTCKEMGMPGSVIMKQKLKIVFSEEQSPKTLQYRQVVHFSEGLFYRLGWKNFKAVPVFIAQDAGQIQCSVQVPLWGEVKKPAVTVAKLVGRVKWQQV